MRGARPQKGATLMSTPPYDPSILQNLQWRCIGPPRGDHARRQIGQVDRRLLQGERIPHQEKVFSIFAGWWPWPVTPPTP